VARAYVGIGANLGEREETIRQAVELLGAGAEVEVAALSTLRETDPWGPVPQPTYLNGAAVLETTLAPRELLERLLAVERLLGRTRDGERYGPRTIDLDLLLYDDVVLDEPGLELPHPRLHERTFVLDPLVELDPGLEIPGRGPVAALRAALDSSA
jgi:2-amino-4-hydroxy-6-hydroxymethyldihydropteridine diphosphokinase